MTCTVAWEASGASLVANGAATAEEVAAALRTLTGRGRDATLSQLLLDLRDIELSGQWEDVATIVLALGTKHEGAAPQCKVAIVVRTSGVALLGRIGPLWTIAPTYVRPFLNNLEARAWLSEDGGVSAKAA